MVSIGRAAVLSRSFLPDDTLVQPNSWRMFQPASRNRVVTWLHQGWASATWTAETLKFASMHGHYSLECCFSHLEFAWVDCSSIPQHGTFSIWGKRLRLVSHLFWKQTPIRILWHSIILIWRYCWAPRNDLVSLSLETQSNYRSW